MSELRNRKMVNEFGHYLFIVLLGVLYCSSNMHFGQVEQQCKLCINYVLYRYFNII